MSAGLWRAPARTTEAIALYDAAAADQTEHPDRYSLSAFALQRAVAVRYGEEAVLQIPSGLTRLAEEAGTAARLNALGANAIRRLLLSLVEKRVALDAYVSERPAVAEREIVAPVFIVGGWRTGTTLLHRALASTSVLRAVSFWEWADPLAAASNDRLRRTTSIARATRGFETQYTLNPTKQRVHAAGAEMAEECVVGMGTDGLNWALLSSIWAPEYGQWLSRQDFRSAYRLHRRTLQLLQGDAEKTRWILKAPAHTAELEALLSVYPDARIVHLHRGTLETVASAAHLFAVFQSTYSDTVDPLAVGRFQQETLATWFDRATAARAGIADEKSRFFDVHYRALVADPPRIVGKLFEWLELPTKPAVEAARAYTDATPHLGGYAYDPSEFGLDSEAIRRRFAHYRNRFDVD